MNRRFFSMGKVLPLVGLALAAYLAVLLIQTVKRNYDLKRQISGLEDRIEKLSTEQDELKYKVQYYQTESYKEKEARAKLGLQAPGESVIILPKQQPNAVEIEAAQKAKSKSNLRQWWEFLFG